MGSQDDLINFIQDDRTIAKAVEGSMDKRKKTMPGNTELDEKISPLALELAQRRLSADIDQGLSLSHKFILKKAPNKKWGDKYGGFSWCPDCEGFAWGLGGTCPTRYKEALEIKVAELSKQLEGDL